MSKEGKAIHPVGRAILAIIALIVIVVSGNMLVASLGIGHKTLDLTENRIHSLSDGTREILSDLGAPVEIRYYATRSSRYMPEDLKLHVRRVDDLLAEYQNLADGQLRIEKLDPQPDTDAEDSANLDGISGQTINNENIYFGLAISCLDRTATIPFLDPNDETMLEYEISRAIAEVSATRKPVIGVMSALDLAGGPPMGMGQPPMQPWVIYNELEQSYEVEDLGMEPGEIDPEKYALLLVVHPAEITPAAEFAIDQYVLQGGTVMACLDSFSLVAQMTSAGGNQMMGQQGTPTSSTFPTLLDAWGVEMKPNEVVGDPLYQTMMQGNRPALAVLTVPQEGMPQEDSIVTRDLNSVTFLLPGGMTKPGGAGLEMETLVKASSNSGLVDSFKASRLDPSLNTSFRSDDKSYDLALRLSGNFKTAFPDGDPSAPPAEDGEDAGDTDGENADADADAEVVNESDETSERPLKEATEPGNVFLISDVDAFYDSFAYRVQRLGNVQFAQPINGNSSLFFNLIDSAAASTHLIGARSRAATSRPFTVFRELEAEAQERVGARIAEFEEEAQQAQQRLDELQAQRSQGDDLYLSPEQEAEVRKLRAQEVEARRQIRELEKDLRRQKDEIAARIITYNIAGVPAVVVVLGLLLFLARRARTRAR